MEHYESVQPGLAHRIMAMAEREQDFASRALESDIDDRKADRREAFFGQLCGLVIALVGLGCGTYAIINGHPVAGSVLGGGMIASIVTVFVYGRAQSGRDNASGSDATKGQ